MEREKIEITMAEHSRRVDQAGDGKRNEIKPRDLLFYPAARIGER